MIQLLNNFDQTYSVLQSGVVIFTGSITEAMQLHAKLSYAARTPAKASTKMQKREERKQGGQRV